MKSEIKTCQVCKKEFTIEPEDFSFYEKIKIPPPTFCPECRTIRRLSWRNEMSLFKRKCDAPGHEEMLISFIHPEEKLVVYDSRYWWSDKWNPISYGKEYDFSRPFFAQWKELRDSFPIQCLSNIKATNSDYCNVAEGSKDSYLSSASWRIDRTFYSNRISYTKDCADLYVVHKSELCYEDIFCTDCYHVMYSFNCKSCVNSYFLYDCHGCIDCFMCSNMRNKSYCFLNKQLSKEDYFKCLSEVDLKSYKAVEELKKEFEEMRLRSLHRYMNYTKIVNSTGDNLDGVKNCKFAFDASGTRIEDSKYVHWVAMQAKDAYDSGPGVGEAELVYEVFDTGVGNFRNLFTSVVYSSSNVEYSFNCHGCDDIFGCLGLRSKKYCILNKQYTKDEYESLIPKIKEQMMNVPYVDKLGRIYKYGEFFPSELSTFGYNETQAQDYFPITKEKAVEMGYRWREKEKKSYKTTMRAEDMPNNLDETGDDITKEIISCLSHKKKSEDHCLGAFKITLDELNLYRYLKVPLPRFCFNCRHEMRLRKRNPMKLWHRECMCKKKNHGHEGECKNKFDTSYAPDRPEIVYCEQCYNKEVY